MGFVTILNTNFIKWGAENLEMALIIASDTHVAEIWDKVGKALPTHVPYLDPNARFAELIAVPKKQDLLILNGDLIDSHDTDYQGGGSNWPFFFSKLRRCKAPFLLNLGNHDYRGLEYNLAIYGLHHVNVKRKEMGSLKGWFPFRGLREIESLCFVKHVLPNEYPAARYHDEEGQGVEILMLDTGAEAWNALQYWLSPSKWSFLFSDPPAGEGIDDEELRFLQRHLGKRGKDLFLFMHIPPFFTVDEFSPVSLEPTFHRRLGKHCTTTFFENQWELLISLLESERNICLFAGHVHVPRQFLIDKERRILTTATLQEINKVRSNPRYIKFLTTPGVGVIRPKYFSKVGYLRYEKQRGFSYHYLKSFKKRK
jgi:hypothetical protein